MPDRGAREHEIVVYGATGFTGALTAEYLARHASGLRWALAGRNRTKLEGVRDRLAGIDAGLAELPLIEADAGRPASLAAMAAGTQVVISTVGPYINYGEPLVAACARAGTDYVDLTGEPEFVDRMWLAHHKEAVRTGARLIHSCGFDSIPHDLGALFCVQQLPEGVPLVVEGFVRAGGTFSGGTLHSAVTIMGRLRQGRQVARERRRLEGGPSAGRRVGMTGGVPRKVAAAGGWALPAPTIDPQVVLHSAAALDRYGPDFRYGHYIVVKQLPVAAGLALGTGALVALASLAPTRKALLRLKAPGDGPTPEQREKAWFAVRFIGEGGGERVVCEVTGGDPGYGETSKMLAESALCLARDELAPTAGQVTPAAAMGDALITRLQDAGIGFAVTGSG
ncbi:MAG: saccharopine dehydrogenase NADP-binding domain-containing protein [Actinomycetota bacterium]|nr:saccharopine dehydrogenase NADP-binding domain-containing protein [Actinomycetota bacterium]